MYTRKNPRGGGRWVDRGGGGEERRGDKEIFPNEGDSSKELCSDTPTVPRKNKETLQTLTFKKHSKIKRSCANAFKTLFNRLCTCMFVLSISA